MRPGQPLDLDLIDLAQRHGSAPDQLERQLLRWQDQGLLRYDGLARDILLELHPTGNDIGGSIDRLLTEYAARQDARVEAIAGYASGLACRHRTIAAHFGEQQSRCRDACDICLPTGERAPDAGSTRIAAPSSATGSAAKRADTSAAPPDMVEPIILRCLAQLPFRVGKSGLTKILKGAAGSPIGPERCADFAALSNLTGAAIERAIEQLIDRNLLRRGSGSRPLLSLTQRGAVTLAQNVVQYP